MKHKTNRNKKTKHRKTHTPKTKPEVEYDAIKRSAPSVLYMSPVMKPHLPSSEDIIFQQVVSNHMGNKPIFSITPSSCMYMVEFITQNVSKNKQIIHI